MLLPTEELPPFALVRGRRWYSGDLLFESQDFDSEIEETARVRLERLENVADVKGVPSSLRIAYGIASTLAVARRERFDLSPREAKRSASVHVLHCNSGRKPPQCHSRGHRRRRSRHYSPLLVGNLAGPLPCLATCAAPRSFAARRPRSTPPYLRTRITSSRAARASFHHVQQHRHALRARGSRPASRACALHRFLETVPWHVSSAAGAIGTYAWRVILARRLGVPKDDIDIVDGGPVVRRTTSAAGRHLLVGCDERQLFMCELPHPVSTVKQAHEALRPAAVPKGTLRQGEWFFVAATDNETKQVDGAIARTMAVVFRKTGINRFIPRAGKPHVADELVRVDGLVFARGAVRHPDHATIHLRQWHRVFRNTEAGNNVSVLGGTWID